MSTSFFTFLSIFIFEKSNIYIYIKINIIDEIKEAINFKIYEKSVLAFKYAFNSNFDQYAKALKNNNLAPFEISRDTLR